MWARLERVAVRAKCEGYSLYSMCVHIVSSSGKASCFVPLGSSEAI